jgi:hypothetical protein
MNQDRSRDQDIPNRQSNMEPAEGSRPANESARGDDTQRPQTADATGSEHSGGITNRSLDRERCEQEQLPDRGHSQSER